MPNIKTIGIIGCGAHEESIERLKSLIKAKDLKDVILVKAGEEMPEITIIKPSLMRPEMPPIELMTKSNYQEIKDGRTLRRERRKRERLNKR